MKLSWSQKLFLKINKKVGKYPLLDKIMYFFGQWLIILFAACTGFAMIFEYFKTGSFYIFFVAGVAFFITYFLSYMTALLFFHPRPVKELPHVKELIIPLETWKSFPSDHTIAATLFVLIVVAIFDETPFEMVAFLVASFSAMCVMSGRVYCGVHYPRDILGGIVYACVGASLSVMICSRYFVGF